MNNVVFFDFEVSENSQKIKDIGAKSGNNSFHSGSIHSFIEFIKDAEFLCGHNIIQHDYRFIAPSVEGAGLSPTLIDTLYLSPLLFPKRPYHKLVKDDKILSDQLNNPYNDVLKAEHLFNDEVSAYKNLPSALRQIYCSLLSNCLEFRGFFQFLSEKPVDNLSEIIKDEFHEFICTNANIDYFIDTYPIELAYSLALIYTQDKNSTLPAWILHNFPKVEYVITQLCDTQCTIGCEYCNKHFDIYTKLKQFFDYDSFRTYDGESLQAQAVQAAVDGKSLLAIFPTGGGKSLTFQLPALIAAENMHGLTVVISPLVSLMKDQVDNLIEKNIYDAVTINGLLNPLEKKEAIERVSNGSASILYIAPESLRSKTIEKILCSRHIARFVIDEAHCFSAWGQDFRVDYLYIGKFIRKLQKTKQLEYSIPVSCFTATAKQKVVSDICDYFRKELNIELELYTSKSTRKNLAYKVIHVDSDEQRYKELRNQIQARNCPTIVYVSRTKTTETLANRLSGDGFYALPFNGKMDKEQKIKNQDKFMHEECQIIVATSAFGMGVDKDNVGLVIHYEISESLENYLQEAGRAGRDPKNNADCIVLFNDDDLNKHFELLNQTKLSISEIQQVWKAIKDLTKTRPSLTKSPLEIAQKAGWLSENNPDIETKVKAAIAELERAGFIERGNNVPRVYATSIRPINMDNAGAIIEQSTALSEAEKKNSKRIIKSLISKKYRAKADNDDAESRVDYLADILGLEIQDVISCVNKLREIKILDDDQDMHAYLKYPEPSTAERNLKKLFDIEDFLINNIDKEQNYKELNNKAIENGITKSTVKDIKNILFFWYTKKYIVKKYNEEQKRSSYELKVSRDDLKAQLQCRIDIIKFILDLMYQKVTDINQSVNFSLLEILSAYNSRSNLFASQQKAKIEDIESSLLYLSKVNALEIDGNFLVFYNSLQIRRLQLDNRQKYTKENYKILQDFYTQKMQQIHIVGEYANLMTNSLNRALAYVFDYFNMDYMLFIKKYFKGNRYGEIQRNITANKYKKLFDGLSPIQREIIDDNTSQNIVVTAGPGSGKTMVLVHKLASLLLLEDVKSEQLLMLTFSRAAAIEFKKRLIDLIGSAAYYVEIKTFHSYCFDLMGQIGSVEKSDTVVKDTAKMIEDGEVEVSKITKTVLVIDEAQDMNDEEFSLIKSLMRINENMRVIAVGDDDQNIYAFRGSSSTYMKSLITEFNAKSYEMVDNYRSDKLIVSLANRFSKFISNRMKSSDIKSLSINDGKVLLTKTRSNHVDEVGIKIFYETYKKGTCCILTHTNDTAYRIHQDLIDRDYKAKVIQENNYFTLDNLYELRCFLRKLKSICKTQSISQEDWDTCYKGFMNYFQNSHFINECQALLNDFDKLNKYKYISDLEIFLKESNFSDFITPEENTILISTIHKAKGKEFDNVYLVLEDYQKLDDEEKRAIYVGITRAKHFLSITYDNEIFDNLYIKGVQHNVDDNRYEEMNKVVFPLSLKDVNLKYYKNPKIQRLLKNPYNNYSIKIIENGLTFENNAQDQGTLYYSKARIQKLNDFLQKGYKIDEAEFYCFVYWTDHDTEEEYLIALPILYLSKD